VTSEEGPPVARSMPTAVMIDKKLLIFGGDSAGVAVDELCIADVGDLAAPLAWQEPTISTGAMSLPSARKGMAAIYKSGKVYMFSGHTMKSSGEYEASSEMFAITLSSTSASIAPIDQHGTFLPDARAGATFQDFSKDSIFMFGGTAVDGKPLNDGWVFNTVTHIWSCVYNGHSDLALPTGALCCLHAGKLVAVNAAAGSPKLDVAASLDFEAVRAEYEFVPRMKTKAVAMLTELQTWTEKQEHGLSHNIDDLSGDFKKLLETVAALYDVREARGSKDLLVDQLRELFLDLAIHKVNTKKSLDQLEAVHLKLEEVKKNAPLVKEAVVPIQAQEGKRIRREIQDFTDGVNKYARDFRKFSFLSYSTGATKSYKAMDKEVRCRTLALFLCWTL
jgi:archaellum component FlaC